MDATAATKHLILLVEDNSSDEELAIMAFRKCGVPVTVDVAHDGVEALDYAFGTGRHANRAGAALPAVVLLDLNLPKLDGFEVLTRLRADARTKTLPVVVLTSSIQEEDVRRAYGLGANGYVRKPIEYADTQQAVRMIAEFWLTLNQAPLPAPKA